jgi:hypothetical protein
MTYTLNWKTVSSYKLSIYIFNTHKYLFKVGLDSPRDLLSKSSLDLKNLLHIPQAQAEDILTAASNEAYDWRIREKNGYELIVDQQSDTDMPTSLTTGDTTIDKILKGGIPLGTLTEIVGERFVGCFINAKFMIEGTNKHFH